VDSIRVVKYRKFLEVKVCMVIYEDYEKMNYYQILHGKLIYPAAPKRLPFRRLRYENLLWEVHVDEGC